jgi:hypothetical protein
MARFALIMSGGGARGLRAGEAGSDRRRLRRRPHRVSLVGVERGNAMLQAPVTIRQAFPEGSRAPSSNPGRHVPGWSHRAWAPPATSPGPALQLLYPAENALAQTQRDQLVAVVNLYKALGGGWETS